MEQLANPKQTKAHTDKPQFKQSAAFLQQLGPLKDAFTPHLSDRNPYDRYNLAKLTLRRQNAHLECLNFLISNEINPPRKRASASTPLQHYFWGLGGFRNIHTGIILRPEEKLCEKMHNL